MAARAGHDAVHLRDESLKRLSNGDIFQKGFAEQRIVMTFDLDFGGILAASAGRVVSVVLFRLHDTRTNHVIERLQNVLDQSSPSCLPGPSSSSKKAATASANCPSEAGSELSWNPGTNWSRLAKKSAKGAGSTTGVDGCLNSGFSTLLYHTPVQYR